MLKTSFLIGAVSLFTAANLTAQNVVILEDFEDSIDTASLGDWGGEPRIAIDGVVLSQYTKTGVDDINVTHGNKSLQVALSGAAGWGLDFKITFSDELSQKIHDAIKSTDVARYILRYDYIFPAGTSWMNSSLFSLGDFNNELDSPGTSGGKRTMSVALDLLKGMAEDGAITLRFSDNFGPIEDPFVGPLNVYVDYFRLVDTYAAGAKPVTTVLQGFESATNPTGGAAGFTGWGGTVRTTYSQYTKAGADDIRVSEGTHALQVDFSGPGAWNADFTIPFKDTKLAEVLKLGSDPKPTPEELARYTLRFDIAFPDRNENSKPGWEVISFNTLADGIPYSEARRDASSGQLQTVSMTLDQVNWSDSAEGAPVLMFIANADWEDPGTTLYFDNFRLIDTGAVEIPAGELKIKSAQFDAKTSNLTLTWDSVAGKNYAIDYCQSLGSWPTILAASVPANAGTTTYTATVPKAQCGFLRVRQTN